MGRDVGECCVCFGTIEIGGTLSCGHVMDFSCLQECLSTNPNQCPMCGQEDANPPIKLFFGQNSGGPSSQTSALQGDSNPDPHFVENLQRAVAEYVKVISNLQNIVSKEQNAKAEVEALLKGAKKRLEHQNRLLWSLHHRRLADASVARARLEAALREHREVRNNLQQSIQVLHAQICQLNEATSQREQDLNSKIYWLQQECTRLEQALHAPAPISFQNMVNTVPGMGPGAQLWMEPSTSPPSSSFAQSTNYFASPSEMTTVQPQAAPHSDFENQSFSNSQYTETSSGFEYGNTVNWNAG